MSPPANPIVVIPARMASTRLPGKPLALIAGAPMIVCVWRQAVAANIGPVLVAAGEPEIVAAVEKAGGRAILTDPGLASGSDRVFAALNAADPGGKHDVIVNLQGAMSRARLAVDNAVAFQKTYPTLDVTNVVAAAQAALSDVQVVLASGAN